MSTDLGRGRGRGSNLSRMSYKVKSLHFSSCHPKFLKYVVILIMTLAYQKRRRNKSFFSIFAKNAGFLSTKAKTKLYFFTQATFCTYSSNMYLHDHAIVVCDVSTKHDLYAFFQNKFFSGIRALENLSQQPVFSNFKTNFAIEKFFQILGLDNISLVSTIRRHRILILL